MGQLELVRPGADLQIPKDVLEEVRSGAMDGWPAERVLDWGLRHFAPASPCRPASARARAW